VTGVLPVALGNATKVMGNIVRSGKEYVCVMQLHAPVGEEELARKVDMLVGRIYQRPPLRSSVKRRLRTRTIYYIDVLEFTGKYVLMRVGCEAGTYLRKLCHDLGLLLGVGAHMRELRRTRSGPFKEDETLVTLQELSEAIYMWREEGKEAMLRAVIMPMEKAVCEMPKIVVRDSAVDAIAHGADLAIPGIVRLQENVERGGRVAILTLKGELVAIGESLMDAGEIASREKGLAVKTRRVIMPTGIYPRIWRRK